MVLLLAAPRGNGRKLGEMLHGRRLTAAAAAGPAEARPDVIVTDRAEIAGRRGGDPAVVRIGGDGPADVRLPEDCTPANWHWPVDCWPKSCGCAAAAAARPKSARDSPPRR